ncbi:PIG-L deacetylase family protein [Ramlibacter sp.]|uniref:PIG-L deacetylase family protein n=1 Tax=Ramlibacter sp. TaxID=1917967 RepID=UPI003D0FEFC2
MRERGALFVQPHYDDVALSCGGIAAALARAEMQSHIVTVFASEIVPEMVGDFAAWKHGRWGIEDIDEVVATRREEDAQATAVLGCSARWLGLPDAIYRIGRYTEDAELYGLLDAEEHALAIHLAEEVVGLPEWREGLRVFVPLGVGSHVDHQLAFEAGAQLAKRGVEVWAYEDLPYGIHTPEALTRRLVELQGRIGGEVAVPIADTLEAKLDAIARYRTQLPVIFRFTDDWRGAVAAHALSAGGGVPAERVWRVQELFAE